LTGRLFSRIRPSSSLDIRSTPELTDIRLAGILVGLKAVLKRRAKVAACFHQFEDGGWREGGASSRENRPGE
jgi:hypothetical protein